MNPPKRMWTGGNLRSPKRGERFLVAAGWRRWRRPVRVPRNGERFESLMEEMVQAGLRALEVYHSDHSPADERLFQQQADQYRIAITGGSDFHGALKPHIRLGTGAGNLCVPKTVLD